MPTLEHELRVAVNVSVDGYQEMAGFEVSINGRFWVSTEGQAVRPQHAAARYQMRSRSGGRETTLSERSAYRRVDKVRQFAQSTSVAPTVALLQDVAVVPLYLKVSAPPHGGPSLAVRA